MKNNNVMKIFRYPIFITTKSDIFAMIDILFDPNVLI